MDWLKHNRWFAALLAVCALMLAGELWQIHVVRQRALRAAAQLQTKRQELAWLAQRSPALSEENVQALAADVTLLTQRVAELRASLAGREPWLSTAPAHPRDGYFAIGKFTEHLRTLALRQQVTLQADERFGFATYAHEGPAAVSLAQVHHQRVVVQHLVEQLVEARPHSLVGVRRERPRAVGPAAGAVLPGAATPVGAPEQAADFFAPPARLRVQAPGVIEGELFRIEFIGKTQTLRAFLNALAASRLPLLVRAVEVDPAEAVAAASERAAPLPPEVPMPLVTQNLSRFAVVVECLALVPLAAESAP